MPVGGSGVVTAMFTSVVWANKPGAAFSQQGFKFYNSRFQMSPGLEDADGIGWLRVRSNFVNSKGLSPLLSSFCQVWAGQIITYDNFTTLRNIFFRFRLSEQQLEGWVPNQSVCWIKRQVIK